MSETNKQELIDDLLRNGKTKSWTEYAEQYNLKNGEVARGTWLYYRRDNGMLTINSIIEDVAETITEMGAKLTSFNEDVTNNKAELTATATKKVETLDELVEYTKIDTTKWRITKWTQSVHNNTYQVRAWLEPVNKNTPEEFTNSFQKFLETYKPTERVYPIIGSSYKKRKACIIINKQDAHLNKLDINGSNDLNNRFAVIEEAVSHALNKAAIANDLTKIVYILGSDEFNSEYNSMTTKGTPQQNAVGFHESFEVICNHEVAVLDMMLKGPSEIEVIYVAGNHDEYIGWHMITWLQAYYRDEPRIKFDTSPSYRKYRTYGKTAMMFNHGDAIKPEKLAAIFPIEYKDKWSGNENFYVFTGDRHVTLTKDINGIMFYQIPALSNAKSSWDDKQGYTYTKGELSAFVISEDNGLTDIYKTPI